MYYYCCCYVDEGCEDALSSLVLYAAIGPTRSFGSSLVLDMGTRGSELASLRGTKQTAFELVCLDSHRKLLVKLAFVACLL
jgi:hypothetical protein